MGLGRAARSRWTWCDQGQGQSRAAVHCDTRFGNVPGCNLRFARTVAHQWIAPVVALEQRR